MQRREDAERRRLRRRTLAKCAEFERRAAAAVRVSELPGGEPYNDWYSRNYWRIRRISMAEWAVMPWGFRGTVWMGWVEALSRKHCWWRL